MGELSTWREQVRRKPDGATQSWAPRTAFLDSTLRHEQPFDKPSLLFNEMLTSENKINTQVLGLE